jgi:hypothetical protein
VKLTLQYKKTKAISIVLLLFLGLCRSGLVILSFSVLLKKSCLHALVGHGLCAIRVVCKRPCDGQSLASAVASGVVHRPLFSYVARARGGGPVGLR